MKALTRTERWRHTIQQDWQDSKGRRFMPTYMAVGAVALFAWSLIHEHSWISGLFWLAWMGLCACLMLKYEAANERDRKAEREAETRRLRQEARLRMMLADMERRLTP